MYNQPNEKLDSKYWSINTLTAVNIVFKEEEGDTEDKYGDGEDVESCVDHSADSSSYSSLACYQVTELIPLRYSPWYAVPDVWFVRTTLSLHQDTFGKLARSLGTHTGQTWAE